MIRPDTQLQFTTRRARQLGADQSLTDRHTDRRLQGYCQNGRDRTVSGSDTRHNHPVTNCSEPAHTDWSYMPPKLSTTRPANGNTDDRVA